MKTPRAATALAILLALSSSPSDLFAQEPPSLGLPRYDDFPTFGKANAKDTPAEPAKYDSGLPTSEDLRNRSNITGLIRDKKYASAIELLHEQSLGGDNEQACWMRYTLVDCAIQAGDLAAALREADLALQYAPYDACAHHTRGKVQIARHRPDLALEDFHRAVRLDPRQPAAYASRANAYANRGDYRLALADLREAERLGMAGTKFHTEIGLLLLQLGKEAEAVAQFSEVLKHDRNAAYTLHCRATCYIKAGRMDEAIDDLTAFLALEPDQPEALFKRAYAYQERGDFADALRDLDRFQVTEKGDKAAPHLRRNIIAKLGDAPLLAAEIAKARANEFDATGMMMARFAATGADDERARIAACDDVLRDYPDSTLARLLRAETHRNNEDLAAARADLDLLLNKEPELRTGLFMRNKVLNLIGDHARAAADAERLIRLEPNSPSGYVGLADALAGKDDHAGAITPISRAIDLARGRQFVVNFVAHEKVEGNAKQALTHEEFTRFVEAGEPRSVNGRFFAVFPILGCVTDTGDAMPPPSKVPGVEGLSIFCDVDELYSRRADSYLELNRPKEALADAEVVVKSVDRTGAKASAAFLLRARALRALHKPREAITDAETALSLAKTDVDRADAETLLLSLSFENILLIPMPRTLGGIPMFGE